MSKSFIKRLDWDSEFFGFEIGELNIPDDRLPAEPLFDPAQFDLIYLKTADDVDIVIDGFFKSFSETKVVFSKRITEVSISNDAVQSADEVSFAVNELYSLAFESGKFSRFHLDEKFSTLQFEKLYSKWVDNSLSKMVADDVMIYNAQGLCRGFVTYATKEDFATIGLIAVSPECQGKGIGRALIQAVENRIYRNSIWELRIPTQLENKEACGFYEKMGYQILEKTYIKHYRKT